MDGMASGKHPAHPDGRDPDSLDRALYRATIRPSNSLGRRGFRIVMGGCCLVSVATSVWCWRMGFWPIAGFFGLDMLALYAALRVSARRGLSFEEVAISQLEILLARVSHRGERREWRFNPLWTRLATVEDDEYGLQRLSLVSRRQEVVVARDASPDERARIAADLSRALAQVKKGY